MTTAAAPRHTQFSRVLALTTTELQLLLRNKTVAVSSILLPLALGLFWAYSFPAGEDLRMQAMVVTLQLIVVVGMGVYVTATTTLVARRHARVLKRMRTSGISDRGLLTATLAPTVVLALGQLVVFAVINTVSGVPLPVEPLWLVVAIAGGFALALTAALATAVVTPSPERAQITTLPFTFVVLGAAAVVPLVPADGVLQALVAVPGAAVGTLVQAAYTGEMWGGDAFGIPAVVFPLLALSVWAQVFVWFARKRFRWDPRH
ncbi:ABC transporter permease [Pseudonocardia nigra]|uniref:ABC transporter permease n=1 Tax=Pseudonocardia nigra TaxID=1921578 RepID=UPI001C5FDE13|nr:ABC transporter permease [Pseudonocardia nigra]